MSIPSQQIKQIYKHGYLLRCFNPASEINLIPIFVYKMMTDDEDRNGLFACYNPVKLDAYNKILKGKFRITKEYDYDFEDYDYTITITR